MWQPHRDLNTTSYPASRSLFSSAPRAYSDSHFGQMLVATKETESSPERSESQGMKESSDSILFLPLLATAIWHSMASRLSAHSPTLDFLQDLIQNLREYQQCHHFHGKVVDCGAGLLKPARTQPFLYIVVFVCRNRYRYLLPNLITS